MQEMIQELSGNPLLQPILVLAFALAAGGTVAAGASRVAFGRGPGQVVAGYMAPAPVQPVAEAAEAAGINAALGLLPRQVTRAVQTGGAAGPGLLALLMGLPLIPALGLAALGYILADTTLKGRWRKARLAVEADLPLFVSQLAGQLLVTQAPLKAVEAVVGNLAEGSVLRLWLARLLKGLRLEGSAYLDKGRAEAMQITPLLGLVLYEIGRLAETGGTGFAVAFTTTADELSAILEARAVASSKAEAARQAVLTMLAIMGLVLAMMLSSPTIRAGFAAPTAQLVVGAALAAMAFGYVFLSGMINDALEA
jgi:hypothetical protein